MDLTDNAILSIVIVHFIQWLKNLPWLKSINEQSDLLNRFLSWVLALCTGLGISIATQGDLIQGMSIQINVPAILIMMKNFIINKGLQETYYKLGVKNAHRG